jgi:hypothetical protein
MFCVFSTLASSFSRLQFFLSSQPHSFSFQSKSVEDFSLEIFYAFSTLASFFMFNQNLETWISGFWTPILFHSVEVSRFESWFFNLLVFSTCLLCHSIKFSRFWFFLSPCLDFSHCLKILSFGISFVSCVSQFCTRRGGELIWQRIIRFPVLSLWCCCWKPTTFHCPWS